MAEGSLPTETQKGQRSAQAGGRLRPNRKIAKQLRLLYTKCGRRRYGRRKALPFSECLEQFRRPFGGRKGGPRDDHCKSTR